MKFNQSYLMKSIREDPDIVGARMPLGRIPMSEDLIDLLQTWIELGARND